MAPHKPYIVSIIPARGGSKRLPGKNLMPLAGLPLIAWSIRSSLQCSSISRTFVSTDDPMIAKIALSFGAEVIDRPAELATDESGTLEVLQHGLKIIESRGPTVQGLVLLQPTSPFRRTIDMNRSISLLFSKGASAVVAVSKVKLGPKWMLSIRGEQLDFAFGEDFKQIRTQDQPKLWQPNGALYIYNRATLLSANGYPWGDKVIPVCLEAPYDTDIDDINDYKIAEALAHAFNLNR